MQADSQALQSPVIRSCMYIKQPNSEEVGKLKEEEEEEEEEKKEEVPVSFERLHYVLATLHSQESYT